MKPQRFEKVAVERIYRTVVAIQSPHQPLYEEEEKIFNRTYQDVDNVADALKMKQQK